MAIKLAIGVKPLGADQRAVFKACNGFLHPVVAHGAQAFIGDFGVAFVVAIHERIFFGCPVIALELVSIGFATDFAQHLFQSLRKTGGNQP